MAPPTIADAVGILLKNEAPAVFRLATETLFKVVQNILADPENDAMRRLKRSTNTFSTKIAPAKGAVRFLRAVGFEEEGAGEEASLVLRAPDLKLLEEGKLALKASVKEYSRLQEEARRIENEAAAEKLRMLREVSKSNLRDAEAGARA